MLRTSSPVLGVLLLLTPAPAQEGAALRQLARAVHARDADELPLAERQAAVRALSAFDSKRVGEEALRAYGALEERARELEERRRPILLAGGGGGRTAPWRWQLDPLRTLQSELLGVLVAQRSPEALEVLLRAALGGEALPLSLRAALVRDLPSAEADPRDLAKRLRLLSDREPTDALLGLRFCAALEAHGRGAGEWVIEQLAHREPQVRREACRTLAALRWGGAIEPLLGVLEGEDAALHAPAGRALEELTGQRLGAAASAWRRWLAAEGGPYLSGERELGGGTSTLGDPATTGYYFGIPQTGRSILYVVDRSQSMRNPLRRARRGESPGETRWERCASELRSALNQLGPEQRFALLAFANKLVLFEDGLRPAVPREVARAEEWIENTELELETNTYDALDRAFLLCGRGVFDRAYEPEIDTVFLLSDGLPTARRQGQKGLPPDDTTRILEAVRRWNPLGRVVVHAIALGGDGPGAFLEKLAAENGGRFVAVRG